MGRPRTRSGRGGLLSVTSKAVRGEGGEAGFRLLLCCPLRCAGFDYCADVLRLWLVHFY